MTANTNMSHTIVTIFEDCMTVWKFNTKDEAEEFEDKVKKLNPDITIHYEKQFDTYTVDEAFDELKQCYGLDDDEEDDDEEACIYCREMNDGTISNPLNCDPPPKMINNIWKCYRCCDEEEEEEDLPR